MSSIISRHFILSFCSFVLIDIHVRFIRRLFSLILPIYARIHLQSDLFFTFSHSFLLLDHCIFPCFFVVLLFFSHILSSFICLNYRHMESLYDLRLCIKCPNNQTSSCPIMMILHNICPSLNSKNPLLLPDYNPQLRSFSLTFYRKIMRKTSWVVY